jgi:hypothetical protein
VRLTAGLLSVLLGLGFGVPCAFGIRHLAATGEVWTFMGFPTYGDGPFDRIGIPTSTTLLAAFLTVCCAEVAAGVMIWTDSPGAKVVSLVLLPAELVFWIGFALPFGPPLGIARVVLVLTL